MLYYCVLCALHIHTRACIHSLQLWSRNDVIPCNDTNTDRIYMSLLAILRIYAGVLVLITVQYYVYMLVY